MSLSKTDLKGQDNLYNLLTGFVFIYFCYQIFFVIQFQKLFYFEISMEISIFDSVSLFNKCDFFFLLCVVFLFYI